MKNRSQRKMHEISSYIIESPFGGPCARNTNNTLAGNANRDRGF